MHILILVSHVTYYYSLLYVPVLVYIDCMPLRILHIGDERKTVMAAHTGIGVFSGEPTEWEDYVERLENCFVVHDIKKEAKKRAVLFSDYGVTNDKLIKSLIAPQKPSDVEYKILDKAKQHLAPAPSCIVEHYKFNTRVLQPSESIASFVAQLRALVTHCEFDEMLEDILCDRIVCRVSDSRIQRKLLTEPKLTFANAVELLQSMKSAAKNSETIPSQRYCTSTPYSNHMLSL